MLRKRPEDPFADQLEWLNHRYDPGYFLGGTLRPELRLSLGTRAKRFAGVLAFGSGLALLGMTLAVSWTMGFIPEPYSWGYTVLTLLVGRKLWRAAAAEGEMDIADEKQRLFRLTAMVTLATVLVTIGGLTTILLLAAATAMIKGHMAIAASLAVLFVLAALRRRGEL